MADEIIQLRIALNSEQAQSALERLNRDAAFGKLNDSVRQLGLTLDRSIGELQRQSAAANAARTSVGGLSGAITSLRSAVPAIAGAIGAFKLLDLARDTAVAGLELNNLDARLQTVFGSSAAASREFEFVRETANRLSLDLRAVGNSYSSLAAASKGTSLEGAATRDIFSAVAEASGRLKLSADQTEGALLAVSQIISKGTVSAEELRGQLGERLPGAFQIAARSIGVSTMELGKLLEAGTLVSDEFLPKFAAELRRTFGTNSQTEIENYNSGLTRLANNAQGLSQRFFTPLASGADGLAGKLASVVGAADRALKAVDSLFENYDNGLENLGNGILRSRTDGKLFEQRGSNLVPLQQVTYNDPASVSRVSRGDIRNVVPLAQRPIVPDFGALVPNPSAPALTGANLLGSGVPAANQKELNTLRERAAELSARLAGLTNVERTQQSILNGELRGRNALEQQAALDVAKLQDAIEAKSSVSRDVAKLDKADARDRLEDLRAEIEAESQLQSILVSIQTPAEQFARSLADINRQAADGTLDDLARRLNTTREDVQNRLLIAAGNKLPSPVSDEVIAETQQRFDVLTTFAEEAGRNIQDALAGALRNGFDGGLKGALRSLAGFLADAASQLAASGILNALFGNQGGAAGLLGSGGFGAVVGSLFSGLGFANGGNPPVGRASLVGERGPELFIPRVPGTIIPNNRLGDFGQLGASLSSGNGAITINAPIDARGAQDPAGILRAGAALKADILQSVGKAMQRGYSPGSN